MKKETLLKEILAADLARAKKKNPRYSLRAHAKKLGVSPATLSRLLAGKSNLSQKMLNQIIRDLPMDAGQKVALQQREYDPYRSVIADGDLAALVNKWYVSPIVCLVETKDFREDPQWIAKRLGITPQQARSGLALLKRIGFVRPDQDGRLQVVESAISTTSTAPVAGRSRNLLDKVSLVRRNLLDTSAKTLELSDISSIVMTTNSRKIPEAKNRIRKFRRSLAKFLDAGEKEEAYLIFIQLIPLSKKV